jgi:septal ring factor EnvC (AmiA/AmiB activator)
MTETATQTRLRRAKEALATARAQEDDLRKALAVAMQTTARARERVSELFAQEEKEEVARRMQDYRHCTL